MPVTVRVADHDPEAWPRGGWEREKRLAAKTSEQVLKAINHKKAEEIAGIMSTGIGQQTSLTDERLKDMAFEATDHGLIRGALEAYNYHHHLVLRPEDIWFAVLTQFSFYVNAHAEKLRSSFVAHKGKKGLIVEDPGQDDMGLMCRNMTKLIDKNIVDPKLREWILPSFSTTTMHDEVVASVIMMGTLQKYFEYVFDCTCCGIPTVTLLGELEDWVEIQRRIEKLQEYGKEPSLFCESLRPIISNFIATFTEPPGDASVKRFWSQIINHTSGSGMNYLTGWIIAFCFWDEDGKCLVRKDALKKGQNDSIDGIVQRHVDFDEVPAGFVTCPVTYVDPSGTTFDAKLLAGFAGYEATKAVNHPWKQGTKVPKDTRSREAKDILSKSTPSWDFMDPFEGRWAKSSESKSEEAESRNSLQPVTAWWMFLLPGQKNQNREEFYKNKLEGDWTGQASTMEISRTADGPEHVEFHDGVPRTVELPPSTRKSDNAKGTI